MWSQWESKTTFLKIQDRKSAIFLVWTVACHLLQLKMCPLPNLNIWLQLVVTNLCHLGLFFFSASLCWMQTWCKAFFFLVKILVPDSAWILLWFCHWAAALTLSESINYLTWKKKNLANEDVSSIKYMFVQHFCPSKESVTEAGELLRECSPKALCSTWKMKYCTNRVSVDCIDQAYFNLYLYFFLQILSEIAMLCSHAAKISPGMQDIGHWTSPSMHK